MGQIFIVATKASNAHQAGRRSDPGRAVAFLLVPCSMARDEESE